MQQNLDWRENMGPVETGAGSLGRVEKIETSARGQSKRIGSICGSIRMGSHLC